MVDGRDGLHTGTGQERFKEGAKSKVEGSEAFFTGTARDRGDLPIGKTRSIYTTCTCSFILQLGLLHLHISGKKVH